MDEKINTKIVLDKSAGAEIGKAGDFEEKANKVTSLSSESTDEQYPSAKAVYDIIGNVESLLAEI